MSPLKVSTSRVRIWSRIGPGGVKGSGPRCGGPGGAADRLPSPTPEVLLACERRLCESVASIRSMIVSRFSLAVTTTRTGRARKHLANPDMRTPQDDTSPGTGHVTPFGV